jgi:hypothetical protein
MNSTPPANTGDQQDLAGRDNRGRFSSGVSGNPKGRSRGSRNKASIALDAIGGKYSEIVLGAMIKKAVSGDTTAGRVILDRVWPAARGRHISLPLPPITDAASALSALTAVIRAVGSAEITTSEAASLVSLITSATKIIETAELERRVTELEHKIGIKDPDHEAGSPHRSP